MRMIGMHRQLYVESPGTISPFENGSSKPTVQFFSQASPMFDPALEQIYPFDQNVEVSVGRSNSSHQVLIGFERVWK